MLRYAYSHEQISCVGLSEESAARELDRVLNQKGQDGWQLVSTKVYRGADGDVLLIVFERKTRDVE